jgi:AraC-like DNA-binding protein
MRSRQALSVIDPIRHLQTAIRAASKGSSRRRGHKLILTRFEAFLKANPNKSLYLPKICSAIRTPERTLRSACEKHLGMGPIRYLALRRMHLFRRALLQATPSKKTVKEIAHDHGFRELGRSSVSYRKMFGETPSTTLHRTNRKRVRQPG